MNALDRAEGAKWVAWQGDCVELMAGMPEGSVDLTVTSIPFANLFCYGASERDFGNARDHREFFDQFEHGLRAWYRVTKPGRLACVHLMNLPSLKTRDGYVGLIDFRGQVISAFVRTGWIYTSEVVIWKSPVVAAVRTHALGLMYQTLRKDSTMSRMGIPDTIVMFRRPGDNAERVAHTYDSFTLDQWRDWASPVWMDIDQSDTLQIAAAREEKDEKHVCPLQIEPIRRCVELYSNPDDVVFDPFGGIGSTVYTAIKHGRRGVMHELKRSYYEQALLNIRRAEIESAQPDLFSLPIGTRDARP